MHIEIDAIEIAFLIFTWFTCLWSFRLLALALVSKSINQVKEDLKAPKKKEGREKE